jgi:glycosyltransferase involved in cell wall biosynthesis
MSTNKQHLPVVLHARVLTGTGGGPEKTILNSPRFLKEYGIESACMFMRPPGDAGFAALEARATAAQADIIGVDDRGPLDLSIVKTAIRLCKERNVTVWHAHDYKSNALGLLIRMFHKMHLITTAHGWVNFNTRLTMYYKIDRVAMKWYKRVICVSPDLVERCQEAGMRDDRLTLIDNAIVHTDYETTPSTPAEKARFGFGPDQIVLAAVGRLSEEKGFNNLLDAVSQLVTEGHNVGLIIAGEGHLKDALQDQINQLELQHRVQLAGFLSDPRELYRAIDVYVLSSLREGLPNVVLEAMASQRTVVTTKVNGIPRLVQDGHNGLVAPTNDVEALTVGIRRCLLSANLREEMANEGRRTIEERSTFKRRMAKVVDAYRSLSPQLADQIRQPNNALECAMA